MTNRDLDFETWFSALQVNVLEQTGVDFNDENAVREDYESGRDLYDVLDEIVAEYD